MKSTRLIRVGAVVALVAMSVAASNLTVPAHLRALPARPNIIVIVVDDQRTDTMVAVPAVRHQLGDHGVTFTQMIVSNPLCCPSRAGLLLGAYSHTSGIYTNNSRHQSYGGWPAFVRTGDEQVTIALALHDDGYRTALFGKYFNDFTGTEAPPGWDRFAAFLDQHDGGAYYDYSMLVDGPRGARTEEHGDDPVDYSTSVIERMALQFLQETPADKPFLLYVTPFAPHGRIRPAPQDEGSWQGPSPILSPGFWEEDISDKPAYMEALRDPRSPKDARRQLVQTYETLTSVDRMVAHILEALGDEGLMSRTMIVYTSDNGTLVGEHHWRFKMSPHEESIRVPLVIRYDPMTGPYAGRRISALVSNVDVVPTIAELTGVTYEGVGIDGRSLVPLLQGGRAPTHPVGVVLEHKNFLITYPIPSYCGVRTARYTFVRYVTRERELYDLAHDPYQLENLAKERPELARRLLERTKRLCDPPPPGYTW